MKGSIWTEEEEAKLKEYVIAGMSYYQISLLMKKSKNSVLGKANRLKLPYKMSKPKNKQPRIKEAFFKSEPYTPKILPDAPASLNIKLLDLEKHNCRYIAGDDRLFCGHNTVEGSSYCEYHKAVCCVATLPLCVKD